MNKVRIDTEYYICPIRFGAWLQARGAELVGYDHIERTNSYIVSLGSMTREQLADGAQLFIF